MKLAISYFNRIQMHLNVKEGACRTNISPKNSSSLCGDLSLESQCMLDLRETSLSGFLFLSDTSKVLFELCMNLTWKLLNVCEASCRSFEMFMQPQSIQNLVTSSAKTRKGFPPQESNDKIKKINYSYRDWDDEVTPRWGSPTLINQKNLPTRGYFMK